VILSYAGGLPHVFLVFSDDTHFEMYGGRDNLIMGAKGVDPGGVAHVLEILHGEGHQVQASE
jgi:hypothetical protein